MAQQFVQAFCVDATQWDAIANESGREDLFGEKAFAFGDYTPCVADGAILSTSYLLCIIFAAVRLGQLCSTSNKTKGRVVNKGRMVYRFILVLLIWVLFLFQLLKDYIYPAIAGTSNTTSPKDNTTVAEYSSLGDVYMVETMAPFQILSRGLSVLGWGLVLIVSGIETSIFTPVGNWMMTFVALMDLLCQLVKLYVVLTLYVSVSDTVADKYVGNDIWIFVAQLGITLFLALLPMCGRPRLSEEFEVAMKSDRAALVQMEDPLLSEGDGPTDEDEEPEDAGPFPEYKTNIVSRLCFFWVCPLLAKGRRHALQFGDIWRLQVRPVLALCSFVSTNLCRCRHRHRHRCCYCCRFSCFSSYYRYAACDVFTFWQGPDTTENASASFKAAWDIELRKEKPSLNKAIFKANCGHIILGAFLQAMSIASSLVCPVFIQLFSLYLTPDENGAFERMVAQRMITTVDTESFV